VKHYHSNLGTIGMIWVKHEVHWDLHL